MLSGLMLLQAKSLQLDLLIPEEECSEVIGFAEVVQAAKLYISPGPRSLAMSRTPRPPPLRAPPYPLSFLPSPVSAALQHKLIAF